jgi:hypothetical protein
MRLRHTASTAENFSSQRDEIDAFGPEGPLRVEGPINDSSVLSVVGIAFGSVGYLVIKRADNQ